MKKLVSALISILLITLSCVQVLAVEGADEAITNMEYNNYLNYVRYCESYYIEYEGITPNDFPIWSETSTQILTEAISYARKRNITTKSELDEAYNDMIDATSKMSVDKKELEFMIYLFEKETNNGYYDAETWNAVQSLLADAKVAYEGDDEKLIHHFYVEMRNTYDDICTYNTVYGDFNGDGKLNIVDITYAQKYLAELNSFNSSQKYLAFIDGDSVSDLSITTVTYMQKYIVGLVTEFGNSDLDKLEAYEGLYESTTLDPNLMEYPFSITSCGINIVYYSEFSAYFHPHQ